MRIGPTPLIPLNPLQPDRTVQYPKALGAEFVGNPRLKFPEVKLKAPEPLELQPREPKALGAKDGLTSLQAPEPRKVEPTPTRGALLPFPTPRSASDPAGPLGTRVDLLA